MRKLVTSVLLVVGCASNPSSSIDDPVGESSEALTAGQCEYFAHDGTVTVCHATGSQRNPFQIIKTSVESCAGHTAHASDYIAVDDPTCSGLGCYPENAPYDSTAPCCDGLEPVDGFCKAVPTSCSVTFGSPSSYSVGSYPGSVAVADVDGNGTLDAAVGVGNAQHATLLLGNGAGALSIGGSFAVTPGGGPSGVAFGDLDHDGKVDLAAAGLPGVFVLRGNGDGTFQPAIENQTGFGAFKLAIGDLDHDGDADIAAVDENASLWVLLNHGDATFAAALAYPVGPNPAALSLGDYDHDGDLDVATANYGGATASVLLNHGDGTFAPAVDYATPGGNASYSIVAANLDADSNLDLAVLSHDTADVTILHGNGDGTFAQGGIAQADYFGFSMTAGDVDLDGKQDLVVAALYNVQVLRGHGDGTFATPYTVWVGGLPADVALGDFNADGFPDILNGAANDTPISLTLNTGCQ